MTVAEFIALPAFRQFASNPTGDVQAALDEAALFVGERWEEYATLGLSNYAAHKLVWDAVVNGEDSASFDDGTVVGMTAGKLSEQRSSELVKMQFVDPMNYTKYGRLYLMYARLAGMGSVAV